MGDACSIAVVTAPWSARQWAGYIILLLYHCQDSIALLPSFHGLSFIF